MNPICMIESYRTETDKRMQAEYCQFAQDKPSGPDYKGRACWIGFKCYNKENPSDEPVVEQYVNNRYANSMLNLADQDYTLKQGYMFNPSDAGYQPPLQKPDSVEGYCGCQKAYVEPYVSPYEGRRQEYDYATKASGYQKSPVEYFTNCPKKNNLRKMSLRNV